jgi:spore coat polysaccharide biosynthesis protein SpsF
MEYNFNLWNEYTDENEGLVQDELAKFIYHLTLGLGAKTVLEAGCNVGNNLCGFPPSFNVYGIDMNKKALRKAREKYPTFHFDEGSIINMPYKDSQFDLVFTRGVLIHVNQNDMPNAIKEILRVSKKWIINIEYFGEDGKMIKWKRGDNLLWYRDMSKWWKSNDVEIISEVDMPEELDRGITRLTIVRKRCVLSRNYPCE